MTLNVENIDAVINRLGGCGLFQVMLASFVFSARMLISLSMIMMTFGNYNPGWHCVDNSTETNFTDITNTMDIQPALNNTADMCHVYKACNNVQFTRGISTVVSEWHLVCDRSWIPPLIISVQMAGVFLGAYFSGYFGDKFGRKRITCLAILCHMIANVTAIFSSSWQMFVGLRFLIGLTVPLMSIPPTVLLLEFVPARWRNAVSCCPIWSLGCILFTILAMVTENWKYLHLITAVLSFIILLPSYWAPESLRWLVIKSRTTEASVTISRIAKLNGKNLLEAEATDWISNHRKGKSSSQAYSVFHLLKKGFRYPTFVVGFICLSVNLIYYSIAFGMKAMPGNLYINLLILFSCDLSLVPISLTIPNYLGRKLSIIIFLIISTSALFVLVGLDTGVTGHVRNVGLLVAAVSASAAMGAVWDISFNFVGEIYPTIIRSTSISYMLWVSRAGSIVAPYLIPDNDNANVINFSIMGILALLSSVFVIFLPETKGKPLQDLMTTHTADL